MISITVKNEDNREMNIKGDIALIVSQTKEKDGFSIGMTLVGSASTSDLIMLRIALLTEAKRKLDDEILNNLLEIKKDSTEDEFNKAIDSIEDENTKNVILEYIKSKGGQA